MVKIIVSLLFLGILASCTTMVPLSITKTNQIEKYLKIDGYYVSFDNYSPTCKSNEGVTIKFIFSNGVMLDPAGTCKTELEEKINFMVTDSFHKSVNNMHGDATFWGVVQINGDSIILEQWDPSNGGDLKTIKSYGKILNDTSFLLTSFYNNYYNKWGKRNELFTFRKFVPRPDSTNQFVK